MYAQSSDGYLFTSESVTEGHPDKIADQISDSVLDAILAEDEDARVACETFVTTGLCVIAGEVTTSTYVDVQKIARETILRIGYDNSEIGFDGRTAGVLVSLDEQSPEIAMGVDEGYEQRNGETGDAFDQHGAGDQGMMFGYASSETEELMPLPITLAHALTQRLAEVRKGGQVPWLRPDGKAQVTVEYDSSDEPVRVHTVVLSTQHAPMHDGIELSKSDIIRDTMIEQVIRPALESKGARWWDDDIVCHVNPTGAFVLGGPHADAGLTGRKIIVDTYGGASRHGGGAFSGKDPSKVDRSAAYAARWVAKHVVAAGLASRCELQVAYAIGMSRPVSLHVQTFGTETVPVRQIEAAIAAVFDLRPGAIIEHLELRTTRYAPVAAYGHFGRTDLDLPWERLDRLDELRAAIGDGAASAIVTA